MLDLRYVTDNMSAARAALETRSADDAALLDPVADLAARRVALIGSHEAKQAERNKASKAMGQLDKTSPEFAQNREQLKLLSAEVKKLEADRGAVEQELDTLLATIPNLPSAATPIGKSEEDNQVESVWGEPPALDFEPKAHDDVGKALGILDFERAAKLSGPRFVVAFGAGALLERALIAFMLDLHTREHGYTEVMPPFMIKDSALYGTGQLPKFAGDLFRTSKADPDKTYELFLTPTAEVPLTNLHADEILDGDALPLKYCAYTPCFRSEAGSYGKDVRGMIRQHQFNKVELVRFCRPEDALDNLEQLTRDAETVLKRLGLHHRRTALCSADLGFASEKTFDLEVWLPAQGKFREISSCSSCGQFQARRAKIRFRRDKQSKPEHVATLNGSGLAVGRTVVAILEQCQRADGSVTVPEVLRPYMGGLALIEKRV